MWSSWAGARWVAAASVLAQLWAASTTGNSAAAFRVAYTSEEAAVSTVNSHTAGAGPTLEDDGQDVPVCGVERAEEGSAAAGLDPPPDGDQRVQAGQLGQHLQGHLDSGHRSAPGPHLPQLLLLEAEPASGAERHSQPRHTQPPGGGGAGQGWVVRQMIVSIRGWPS